MSAPAVTEVHIGALGEGALIFLPDATTGNPVDPCDAAAYPGWWLADGRPGAADAAQLGSLVAFERNAPGRPSRATVRYSKCRLTEEFLFTTLAQRLRHHSSSTGNSSTPPTPSSMPIAFLAELSRACSTPTTRRISRWRRCQPSVLASAGSTVLRVAAATLSCRVRDLAWFAPASRVRRPGATRPRAPSRISATTPLTRAILGDLASGPSSRPVGSAFMPDTTSRFERRDAAVHGSK